MRLTIVNEKFLPQLSHAELSEIVAASLPLIDKTTPMLARQDTDDNEINRYLALINFIINLQGCDLQTELTKFMADLSPASTVFYLLIATTDDINQQIGFWNNQDQLTQAIQAYLNDTSNNEISHEQLSDTSKSPRGVIHQAVNLYLRINKNKTKQEQQILKHRTLMQVVKKCMCHVEYNKSNKEISFSVQSKSLITLMHEWLISFSKIKEGSENKNTNEIIFETTNLYRESLQAIIVHYMNHLNHFNAITQLALIHRVANFCLSLHDANEKEATDSGLTTLFQANFFAMIGLCYPKQIIQEQGLKNISLFNSSLFICFVKLNKDGAQWFETPFVPDLYQKMDTPRPKNNKLLSRSVSVSSLLPKFGGLTFSPRRYHSTEEIKMNGHYDNQRQRAHTVTLLKKHK